MVTPLRQTPLSASAPAAFRTGLHPLVVALLLALGPRAFALPTDPTVVAGQAVVRGAGGNTLVIDQASGKAAIDWRSFNLGAGEAVRFNQPSAAAMTVNRVTSGNPSEILGLISAPGTVFLVNPAGILFGRTAVVDVGSLVASTLTASTADLLSGRAVFNAAPGGSGAVRNAGLISAAPGGSVSLIGTQVSNTGSIATPGGSAGLIAGERVSVDFEGDGLVRYQVDVAAARARVDQGGQISADGGRVALQAGARDALVDTVLNMDGVVRARGISQRNGEIYLDGGTRGSVLVSGTLDASGTAPGTAGGQLRVLGENVGLVGAARLDASGDAGGGSVRVGGNYQGRGPEHNATRAFVGSGVTINADALSRGEGGRVITWADDWTRFYGTISARGGAAGGDGGFVEVSGKRNLAFSGSVVTTAPRGRVGTLLLDPGDLYLGADPSLTPAATDSAASLPNFAGTSGADYFVSAGSFSSATSYTLSATQDVIFNTDLGFPSTSGQWVSIQAGRDIRQGGGVSSISTQGAGLSLTAGTDATLTGKITLSAGISTHGGTLTLSADGASELAGVLAGGAAALVKEGTGSLTLSNAGNTYSGGTTIREGTLRTALTAALPAGGAVSLEGSGVLDLAGTTQRIGNLSGASGTSIALGSAGNGGLTVTQTVDGIFAGTMSGVGPGGSPLNAGALNKLGTGALVLSGANTFTGMTRVEDGVLRVTNADAFAATGASLWVTGSGTFEIDGVALRPLDSLTLAGGSQGLETLAGRGTASYGGTVTMIGHARLQAAGASDTLTLSGQIDGRTDTPTGAAPILQKVGDGTLALGGAGGFHYPEIWAGTLKATSNGVLPATATRLFTGATLDLTDTTQTIGSLEGAAGARIVLGATGSLGIAQGLEHGFEGSILGGSGSSLSKSGLATLHLSGTSPNYSGTTRVQSGTLSVGGSGSVLGAGAVEVSAGATLGIDAVNLGVTSLSLRGSGASGNGVLTGSGAARYDGSVSLADAAPVVLGVATASDTLTLGGALSGGPAMSVVKRGLGLLDLGGSASHGGGTRIEAGEVVVRHADGLGAGAVEVSGGATLKIASPPLNPAGVTLRSASLTLNGHGVDGSGALQGEGTVGYDSTSALASITLATASTIGAAAGSTLTLSRPVTGGGHLTKAGGGVVNLSRGGSYTGGTTVDAGTLVAQHAAALGSGPVGVAAGATLQIDNVALSSGALTLNGGGVGGGGALQGSGAASHSGPLELATASAIGAAAGSSLTLHSPVTGARLSKVGDGVVTLSGDNRYAGGTTIEAGTLSLSAGATLPGLGAVSLTGTGILDLNDTHQSIGNLSGEPGTHVMLGGAGRGGVTVTQTTDGIFAGTLSGVGPGGSAPNAGALNKLGAAVLTLSGANTFSGAAWVSEGVLRVTNPEAFAATGASLWATGSGTFEIDGVALRALDSLTLAGGLQGRETLAGRGAAAYGGTVTMLGFARMGAAGLSDALRLTGRIDGQRDQGGDPTLTKVGAGTVTLSGSNNLYTGGTLVEAGTLVAQHAAALGSGPIGVAAGATLQIDNVALSSGALTLNGGGVGGGGALQGSGAASHSGPLELATASAIGAAAGSSLTLHSPVTGARLSKVGDGVVTLSGDNRYAGGTTIEAGTLSLSAGATLPGLGDVSLTGTGILDLNDTHQSIGKLVGEAGTGVALGSGSLTLLQGSDGTFAGRVSGTGDLTKRGAAALTLSGPSSGYRGTTRVEAGTLVARDALRALGVGTVSVSDGATLKIDNAALSTGGVTLNGRGVGGGGALQGSGTAIHTGDVTLATASAVGTATSAEILTLNGSLTGVSLTKLGQGVVDLAGTNRYTGGTMVEAGTLRLLAGATLPNLGAVSLTGTGVLDLNGTRQSIGNLSGTTGTGIALGAGTLTVTQDSPGTFSGRVSGSGSLAKQGPASLTLSGDSTGYSGTSQVAGGTLVATGSGSALGRGAVVVSDAATLNIDGLTLGVSSISLQGAGVGGQGALTATGTARYDGSMGFTGPAAIGVAAAGDSLSLGGVLSGGAAAGLTKLGAGTLRLAGASTYAGGTTIGAGNLEAVGDGALGSGQVQVQAGALKVGSATLANSIVLAGGPLSAIGAAQLTGVVSQTVDSTISSAVAPASLTLRQAFAGGGHTLTIDGPGVVGLVGGAGGLASIVQNLGSELRIGTGSEIVSSGGQAYNGIVTGHDVGLTSTTRQAITAVHRSNDFAGTLHVTAGDTALRDSNALSVTLNTGATTLTAGQALMLSGTAASLEATAGSGAIGQQAGEALQVTGPTTLDAGRQAVSLTEAGNLFGGLVTVRAGQTALHGREDLAVALASGATTLSAGRALLLGGTAASLAATVSGGTISQRPGQALTVSGTTTLAAGSGAVSLTEPGNAFDGLVTVRAGQTALHDRDALTVVLDHTGATTLTAGQALMLSGTAASLEATAGGGAIGQQAGEALQVTGPTTLDVGRQAVSLTEAGNLFGGLVTVRAGQTALHGREDLAVALASGATTLSAGRALLLGGSAASLAATVSGGTISQRPGQALTVSGTTTLDAGSGAVSLTEPGNAFDGLVTVRAGTTRLHSGTNLNGRLDNTGATRLVSSRTITLAGTADSLSTDSAGLIFDQTKVRGAGHFTTRGSVAQRAATALEVDGEMVLAVGLQSEGESVMLANRGNAFGSTLGGSIDLGPSAADSRVHSRQAVRLGGLSITGKGTFEVESSAAMGKTPVLEVSTVVPSSGGVSCSVPQSCVSVQSSVGTPQQLSVYEASIAQQEGSQITTGPNVTLSLNASGKGSIDLSAGAAVSVTPAGGAATTTATGLAGLLSIYSKAGPERRVLTHPGDTTNRIGGPLAALTQADTTQDSADKTVVVLASDSLRVAPRGIDADTVMLIAREVVGGGGKIQTHVAATTMSDDRNIATGVDGKPNQLYSILPSIFVIADAPGNPAATYSFGSLRKPISVSFGYVGVPVVNSLLQTIAVEPFRRGEPGGAVPVYLDTRLQLGADPSGRVRRFLVYPVGTPTGAIRMVVVDGVAILDSSAFASVQSAVAELLNQVRKEQLESGFSNENVAARLRKGVISETRVGPAAVDRFQGVASAQGCVGMRVGEMLVCVPSAGPPPP